MAAYTVVGPTKRKPARRSSFDSASDSGVVERQSLFDFGAGPSTRYDQTSSGSGLPVALID